MKMINLFKIQEQYTDADYYINLNLIEEIHCITDVSHFECFDGISEVICYEEDDDDFEFQVPCIIFYTIDNKKPTILTPKSSFNFVKHLELDFDKITYMDIS